MPGLERDNLTGVRGETVILGKIFHFGHPGYS